MWYVMEAREGQEENTGSRCMDALPPGLCRDIFVPMFICMKRYQGIWHRERKVLFQGYFFLDTDQPEAVRKQLEPLSRITRPVLVGDEFVPVWPEEQKFLESLMDAGHTVQMSEGNFENGEYDIYAGPLRDKGRYLRKVDRHKRLAELEIKLMGQSRRVKVGLEVVRKENSG